MIIEDNSSLLMTAVMLLETGMILLKFSFSFHMLIEEEVVTRLIIRIIRLVLEEYIY